MHTRKLKQRGGSQPTTRQRGGYTDLSTKSEAAIAKLLNDLSNETNILAGSEFSTILQDIIDEGIKQRELKETSDNVRYLTEQILKDGNTPGKLFPNRSAPEEYSKLITMLGEFNKVRKDMNTVIEFVYRYINLKLSYATSSKTQVRRNRNENNNQGFGPRITRTNRLNRGNRNNRSINNNFGPRLTRRNNSGANNFNSGTSIEPKFTRESGYAGLKPEYNKPGDRRENEQENVSF
jgi:hypothetical protein